MRNITELVHIVPSAREEEPEDIFAAAPGLIFTDDLRVLHGGDPESTIVYKSVRFGDVELQTAELQSEDERKLFGHYLWNAGIRMAELISEEGDSAWSVEDKTVLELGAGVGLGGIVATLAGAKEVVISDYPAAAALANLRRNTKRVIPDDSQSVYHVEGHEWGVLDSCFAQENEHRFDRILAADCYWMPSQHHNLVQSMLHFLTTRPEGRVFAIAGFHTGRAKLAPFFEVAEEEGLEVEDIYEEDVEGTKREWRNQRDDGREDHTERKRWLAIARLRRRAA